MAKQESKPETKAFTIKDAALTDIDKFNELKTDKGFTQGKTFSYLVNQPATAANPENVDSLISEIEELKKVNQELEEKVNQVNQPNPEQVNLIAELTANNAELLAQIDELKNRAPETKEIEKQIELSGLQSIIEPTQKVFDMARKARPFMRKDGLFKGADDEFPNELFNIAVPYFLKHKYDELF